MPLKRCGDNGQGWKYGEEGKCYTGPDAKKQAIKQGIAIDGPDKFSQKAYEDQLFMTDAEVEYALKEMQSHAGVKLTDLLRLSLRMMVASRYGNSEELTASNYDSPDEEDYIDVGEEPEEVDIAKEKPGLWENIRRKKQREGDNYRPAKPGDPDRPDPDSYKKAQGKYKYKHPYTGEIYYFDRRGVHKKDGRILIYVSKAAEYQGRKVTLNKPFRTPDGPKKFSVYVRNDKGNIVKVNFGDPNMEIKKDDPKRRKSFRARHNCDNPGPKWKARYWSCKKW